MDLVTLLIKAGAKLDVADSSGRRPIEALPQPQVRAGADDPLTHVLAPGPWERALTLLLPPQLLMHFAASEGQLSLMKQLNATRGCKLEDLNPEGLTPLHVAAMRGDVAMVRGCLVDMT